MPMGLVRQDVKELNQPTWLVLVYLRHDSALRKRVRLAAAGGDADSVCEVLRREFLERHRVPQRPLYSDMLTWCLKQVDWEAVAREARLIPP